MAAMKRDIYTRCAPSGEKNGSCGDQRAHSIMGGHCGKWERNQRMDGEGQREEAVQHGDQDGHVGGQQAGKETQASSTTSNQHMSQQNNSMDLSGGRRPIKTS